MGEIRHSPSSPRQNRESSSVRHRSSDVGEANEISSRPASANRVSTRRPARQSVRSAPRPVCGELSAGGRSNTWQPSSTASESTAQYTVCDRISGRAGPVARRHRSRLVGRQVQPRLRAASRRMPSFSTKCGYSAGLVWMWRASARRTGRGDNRGGRLSCTPGSDRALRWIPNREKVRQKADRPDVSDRDPRRHIPGLLRTVRPHVADSVPLRQTRSSGSSSSAGY